MDETNACAIKAIAQDQPCPVCGGKLRVLISGNKMLCASCGFIPSCSNGEC